MVPIERTVVLFEKQPQCERSGIERWIPTPFMHLEIEVVLWTRSIDTQTQAVPWHNMG